MFCGNAINIQAERKALVYDRKDKQKVMHTYVV